MVEKRAYGQDDCRQQSLLLTTLVTTRPFRNFFLALIQDQIKSLCSIFVKGIVPIKKGETADMLRTMQSQNNNHDGNAARNDFEDAGGDIGDGNTRNVNVSGTADEEFVRDHLRNGLLQPVIRPDTSLSPYYGNYLLAIARNMLESTFAAYEACETDPGDRVISLESDLDLAAHITEVKRAREKAINNQIGKQRTVKQRNASVIHNMRNRNTSGKSNSKSSSDAKSTSAKEDAFKPIMQKFVNELHDQLMAQTDKSGKNSCKDFFEILHNPMKLLEGSIRESRRSLKEYGEFLKSKGKLKDDWIEDTNRHVQLELLHGFFTPAGSEEKVEGVHSADHFNANFVCADSEYGSSDCSSGSGSDSGSTGGDATGSSSDFDKFDSDDSSGSDWNSDNNNYTMNHTSGTNRIINRGTRVRTRSLPFSLSDTPTCEILKLLGKTEKDSVADADKNKQIKESESGKKGSKEWESTKKVKETLGSTSKCVKGYGVVKQFLSIFVEQERWWRERTGCKSSLRSLPMPTASGENRYPNEFSSIHQTFPPLSPQSPDSNADGINNGTNSHPDFHQEQTPHQILQTKIQNAKISHSFNIVCGLITASLLDVSVPEFLDMSVSHSIGNSWEAIDECNLNFMELGRSDESMIRNIHVTM